MRRKCPATSPLLLLQLLLRCSEWGGGVNFGEKDAKVSRAWRDGVRVPGEGTSWDSDSASPELRYRIVGLSQSISTKHPETSPKDSRIRENDVTADGRTTEDHITADPGTTKDSVTADPGTTEDSVTAGPGTTEDSVTAGSWTTEDEITKHGDIHLLRTTSVTAVKPTRLLTPMGIILISLTATTVTVALFVGLGFIVQFWQRHGGFTQSVSFNLPCSFLQNEATPSGCYQEGEYGFGI
ncbi:protein PBMUCL2-like [Piliocolobus tephrosceles]|uniref:protein PBMUCL2-like n=1 Tax=Piliocolobus tephrosceles TaxID=591936 RepID=UPI000C2A8C2D|nr:protein PBMUCL2-like [Piliocolobus tephrosceles]